MSLRAMALPLCRERSSVEGVSSPDKARLRPDTPSTAGTDSAQQRTHRFTRTVGDTTGGRRRRVRGGEDPGDPAAVVVGSGGRVDRGSVPRGPGAGGVHVG